MQPPTAPELPRQTRLFILLVALAQGAALYLLDYGEQHAWPILSAWGGRMFGYTLLLAVPSVLILSVVRLRDVRLWQHIVALTLILGGMCAWIVWNLTGAPSLDSSSVLNNISFSIGIGVFVALSWMQGRQHHGTWRVPYAALFECAWQNTLTLILAVLFTGLCWVVLMLWAQLFLLLDIRFFRTLFEDSAFRHIATGVMAGLGVLIGRTQHRPVQIARQVLLAVFKGLLPLWALIALLFVLSLPVTGLQPLWNTRSAAWMLLTVILLMVLFANAVYQDGGSGTDGETLRALPYPRWLRWLVDVGLLTLPVYAALALVALGLRITQYGWTPERFWGVLVAVVATGYALGYAAAVLRSRQSWLAPLGRVNMRMSWLVVGLAVLANTPVLDGWRLSVASQLPRLHADAPERMNRNDMEWLRFDAGRRGYRALQAMQAEPASMASGMDAVIGDVLRSIRRSMHTDQGIDDLAVLRRHITLAHGSAAPEEAWWQRFSEGKLEPSICRQQYATCVVRRQDFNGDGRDDILLCWLLISTRAHCALHAQDADGVWQVSGTLVFTEKTQRDTTLLSSLEEALRNGAITTQRHPWPDLVLDGGLPQSVNGNDPDAPE